MEASLAATKGNRAMRRAGQSRVHPEMKELVVEAAGALARLDANRLEELAFSCQALNRDLSAHLPTADAEERAALVREAREAARDMAVFARVLEATRANLNVMNRLRQLRESPLEYGAAQAQGDESRWARAERVYGDN